MASRPAEPVAKQMSRPNCCFWLPCPKIQIGRQEWRVLRARSLAPLFIALFLRHLPRRNYLSWGVSWGNRERFAPSPLSLTLALALTQPISIYLRAVLDTKRNRFNEGIIHLFNLYCAASSFRCLLQSRTT
eukprot:scaffold2995_cov140-Skeletonema_marinoi.AAC.17